MLLNETTNYWVPDLNTVLFWIPASDISTYSILYVYYGVMVMSCKEREIILNTQPVTVKYVFLYIYKCTERRQVRLSVHL